jgi:hypothetical protein
LKIFYLRSTITPMNYEKSPNGTPPTPGPDGIEQRESPHDSPDSLVHFYRTEKAKSKPGRRRTTHLMPLLSAIDTYEGTLLQKKAALCYLFYAAEGKIESGAAKLGFTTAEFTESVDVLLSDPGNPDQQPAEHIFAAVTADKAEKLKLVKALAKAHWGVTDIITVIDAHPRSVLNIVKGIRKISETSG